MRSARSGSPPSPGTGVRPAVSFVVRGYRRSLAVMAATAFLGGIAEALFLVTVTRAAFAITDGRERVGIVSSWFLSVDATLALALALVLARVALGCLAAWQSARTSSSVVAAVRRRLASAFMRAEWDVQQNARGGSLQELLIGYSTQAAGLMNGINGSVVAGANLVAMLGLAIAVDPLGALVMVVSVALLGMILRPLRRLVKRRARANTEAGMELATSVNEVANLGMELHIFDVHDAARRRLDDRITRSRDLGEAVSVASGSSSTLYSGLAYLALLAALAVVSASPAASLTSLGAVMLVMLRSLGYGQALQGSYISISSTVPAVEALMERLDDFQGNARHRGDVPIGAIGTLAADHVSFAYVAGQEVLHDVSFEIPAREIVGIVGPSGSGKSTLVQILLGLRDPKEGAILADGRDIRTFDRAEWARKVTFVPQAAHLIAGTITENIAFLRAGVSDADIERAAKLAYLHDDVMRFPEKYERQVGEQGGHLSGGQQQRLCIARALVENPDVLILDEPTSALDVRSEHLVRTTLLELKERMTIIVIAHRLSTLDICDRIMVIQDGKLRGFDTPSNLEQASDFYREALVLSGLR